MGNLRNCKEMKSHKNQRRSDEAKQTLDNGLKQMVDEARKLRQLADEAIELANKLGRGGIFTEEDGNPCKKTVEEIAWKYGIAVPRRIPCHEAAKLVGLSPPMFHKMVLNGTMPVGGATEDAEAGTTRTPIYATRLKKWLNGNDLDSVVNLNVTRWKNSKNSGRRYKARCGDRANTKVR